MASEGPSIFDILHSQAVIERAKLDTRSTVNLSNYRLNILPLSLTSIKFLLNLYLDKNLLHSLPVELTQLENLQVLTLDYNRFNEFPLHVLFLTSLIKLNLSHNPIQAVPSQIYQLECLEVLWLNKTQITKLPSEIGQLPNLEILGARWNKIDQIPREILEMHSLRWLTLRGNKIKYIPEELHLSNIIHLNMSQNLLEEFPNVTNIKSLRYLYLGDNPIHRVDHEDIRRMNHLTLLQLHNVQIPNEYLLEFPYLKVNNPDLDTASEQLEDDESEEDWADSLDTSDINTSEEEDEDDGFNNNWNNHRVITWLPLIAKLGCIK